MKLVSLQLKTIDDFEESLAKLTNLIEKVEINYFILAPELCLTGYSYDRLGDSCEFSLYTITILKSLRGPLKTQII